MNNKTLAIISLVGVSCGYGLLSVAARWLGSSFGIYTQVYIRIFLAMILTIILYPKDLRWEKIRLLSATDWLTLLIMGVVGYGFMVYAITRGALATTLLNVSVLFSTVPIFVYILGIIFLKKTWRYSVLLLLLISIWGVGVVGSGQLIPSLSQFGIGDVWVLLSALFEAIWYLGIKVISKKLNSREITVLAQLIATITIFGVAFSQGEALPSLGAFTSLEVIAGLIIGIVMNVVAPLVTIFSFRHLDEVFATQLFLSENIFALLVGYFFYGETTTIIALFGAAVVIGSVYATNKL